MAVMHLRSGLQHARQAGELLLEAKAKVKHGEWLPWLRNNCQIPERTAQAYRRIAAKWDRIEKSATVAALTFREADKLLASPAVEKSDAERLEEKLRRLQERNAELDPADPLDVVYLLANRLGMKYAPIVYSADATLEQLVHVQRCMLRVENGLFGLRVRLQMALGRILNQAEEAGERELLIKLVNLAAQAEAEGCGEEFAKGLDEIYGPCSPFQFPEGILQQARELKQEFEELLAA
jgi:hypothetical protein